MNSRVVAESPALRLLVLGGHTFHSRRRDAVTAHAIGA